MNKFARLLNLIKLLGREKDWRVEELAKSGGVSTRTVFRDLRLLSQAGLPIQFGPKYRLQSQGIFLPLDLTPSEYLTLYWALNSSLIRKNSNLKIPATKILEKINSHLPPAMLKASSDTLPAVQVELKETGMAERENILFAILQKGMEGNNTVKLDYESLSSGAGWRKVKPYALVFRRHAWYLLGLDHKSQEIRMFRLSRIKKVSLTSEKFEPERGFSAEKYFQESWEVFVGKPVKVKIKFTGKAAKIISSGRRHQSERALVQSDGSVHYSAEVAGWEEISHWILSFGAEAEALEPAELREKLTRTAKEMAAVYSGRYSMVAERKTEYRLGKPERRK